MSKFSPAHYKKGKIEVWDFIIDQELNYLDGCMVKYICRAGEKEGETRLDDLIKVQKYINKAVLTEINATSSTGSDAPSSAVQEDNESANRYVHPWYSSETVNPDN